MSFKSMKRNRKDFTNLVSKLEESKGGNSAQQDERFWKPERDKAGNGYAVVRFLPATDGEDLPWVQLFSHSFQGPGGWYIENCRTTLGQKCPLCEANTELWNTGIESNKNIARDRKRKLSYISNIYIVSDTSNPDNEGKVFMWKYGKSIFNIITEAMDPQFEDEEPINPFDLWDGANFKIKIRNKDGYVNYDKSEFDKSSMINEDESIMEKIWNSQHNLSEFIDQDQFNPYDKQSKRLDRVLGKKTTTAESTMSSSSTQEKFSTNGKETPEPSMEEVPGQSADDIPFDVDDDDDDETLAYFSKLAEED